MVVAPTPRSANRRLATATISSRGSPSAAFPAARGLPVRALRAVVVSSPIAPIVPLGPGGALTRAARSRSLEKSFDTVSKLVTATAEVLPVSSQTATTHGARDHARSQAGIRVEAQPILPASAADDPPPGVDPADLIWEETIAAGGYAAHLVPRGARLRLLDAAGDACAQLMVHRADETAERLNVADTVKVQWQAYLGPGMVLLSDMGRVMASLLEDTSARHDALCGASLPAGNARRYGDGSVYGPSPSGRDRLLLALAKHGLSRRDLPPTVNLFKGVTVDLDGTLVFSGDPAPGRHVTLRAEMDLLVSVANCPHRLDPRGDYTATPLRLTAWRGPVTAPDDPVRTGTPEVLRAFENTEDLLGSGGGAA